ncbi:MAG: hypothetical protein KF823_00720 [Xanthomonadales bacterium]|nr:hypothetical protein [Xanthomonadales bacterium]
MALLARCLEVDVLGNIVAMGLMKMLLGYSALVVLALSFAALLFVGGSALGFLFKPAGLVVVAVAGTILLAFWVSMLMDHFHHYAPESARLVTVCLVFLGVFAAAAYFMLVVVPRASATRRQADVPR